ncbi:MAG TPA: hypothetical protein VEW42_05525 [Candidatus Eisenbacteria bacterium]|nr:hypothetical protein [Candidatus Eisenbacteria bacterium]
MIYDCFTFFNELEILQIRLHELDSVVDKFVLVEGSVTFTNKQKILYFEKNRKLFKEFEKKIIHVIVKDNPKSSNPWDIERFQFNAIQRGLKGAKDDDVILLSCVDEIPKSERINEWKDREKSKTKVFLQRLHYYFLNYVRADNNFWKGTKMLQKRHIKDYKDLYAIRQFDKAIPISDGGWHFSYMGGIKRIQEKLKSFSHTEFSTGKYVNSSFIEKTIRSKSNLFEDFILFKTENIQNLPKYVRINSNKFNKILSPYKSKIDENFLNFFKKLIFKSHKFLRHHSRSNSV